MPPFSNGDIVLCRLYSGEFIIGRFEEAKLGLGAKLARPRSIQLRAERNRPADIQIDFLPIGFPLFTPIEANTIPYPENFTLVAKVAPQDIASGYMQSTSGLQMPKGPLPGLGG